MDAEEFISLDLNPSGSSDFEKDDDGLSQFAKELGVTSDSDGVSSSPKSLAPPAPPPWRKDRKRKRDEVECGSFVELMEERMMDAQLPPWCQGKEYSLNLLRMLHEEIVDFANFIEPTEDEHFLRSLVIDVTNKVLSKVIPGSRVVAFGSYQTKLYLPYSDIDMTLRLPRPPSQYETMMYLNKIGAALRRSPDFVNVEVVRSARVPIVKAVHQQLGIPIDISIHQFTGDDTVNTVKAFMNEYPALRPLVFILKMFLFSRELNEVYLGGISSYSIITMLVCFFNSHPLLVNGEIKAEQNLGVLLIEWFELFSRTASIHSVTVTADGFRSKREQQFARGNPEYLSVRDPNDKANDLSKGARLTKEIIAAFDWAFNLLTNAMIVLGSGKCRPTTLLGLILQVHPAIVEQRADHLAAYSDIMRYSSASTAENRGRPNRRSGNLNHADDRSRVGASKGSRNNQNVQSPSQELVYSGDSRGRNRGTSDGKKGSRNSAAANENQDKSPKSNPKNVHIKYVEHDD